MTQPVFDPDGLERFLGRVSDRRIPVIAGIWPLLSLRNAEFLANEVPGLHVPPPIIERMRRAQAKCADAATAEGIAIAREMRENVARMVQGIQVSAPLGRVDVALAVAAQ